MRLALALAYARVETAYPCFLEIFCLKAEVVRKFSQRPQSGQLLDGAAPLFLYSPECSQQK
jgi:hypothetical protein